MMSIPLDGLANHLLPANNHWPSLAAHLSHLPIGPLDTVCGGRLAANVNQNGLILSHPSFDGSTHYNRNEDCEWIIEAAENQRIRIEFSFFSLETDANCNYDQTVVYDGFDESATQLARLCGNDVGISPFFLPPFSSSSRNNSLSLSLSDRKNSLLLHQLGANFLLLLLLLISLLASFQTDARLKIAPPMLFPLIDGKSACVQLVNGAGGGHDVEMCNCAIVET